MTAAGSHLDYDSLRGAPPLVSKGSLYASPVVLGMLEGIATPVCGLVRNDMRYTRQRIYLSFFIRFSSRPD